jgi:SAM-dependent methyltransferase
MGTLEFDAAATDRLVAVYVTPDVVAQRARFLRALDPRPDERVLDVGSGPGFLAADIAGAVGAAGHVCGVEISEPLVAAARAHCARLPAVEIRQGDAVRLPLPDASFDAVASTQVLEYVADVDAAIAEIFRVVRAGGRIALLDTDWDSIVWHTHDRTRMERVLGVWEEHVPHPRLPRTLARRLRGAGFAVEDVRVIALCNAEFEADSYSNRMIDLIASFVSGRRGVAPDEAAAWAGELRERGAARDYFFSLNRYLFMASKPHSA